MARTTADEVLEILDTDLTEHELTPFIAAANMMVTQWCGDLDDDDAVIVETWLAAHFAAQRDKRTGSEGAGGVSESYTIAIEVGLGNTTYGQMAMRLDYSGGLANAEQAAKVGKRTVGVTWLGTENPDDTE